MALSSAEPMHDPITVSAAGGCGASHSERQDEEYEGAATSEDGLAEQRTRHQAQSAQDLP